MSEASSEVLYQPGSDSIMDLITPKTEDCLFNNPIIVTLVYAQSLCFPASWGMGTDYAPVFDGVVYEGVKAEPVLKHVKQYRDFQHRRFMDALGKFINHHGFDAYVVNFMERQLFPSDMDIDKLNRSTQMRLFAAMDKDYLLLIPDYIPQNDYEAARQSTLREQVAQNERRSLQWGGARRKTAKIDLTGDYL